MRPENRGTRNNKTSESEPLHDVVDVVHVVTREERRVLVIDDHDRARRVVAEHFESHHWNVAIAHDFRSALDVAASHQPHMIITEVSLADARGPHFVRALKTVVDHDVRVVAVTQVPVQLVPTSAFDMVFAKPVDLDAVFDYVEAVMESSSPSAPARGPTNR